MGSKSRNKMKLIEKISNVDNGIRHFFDDKSKIAIMTALMTGGFAPLKTAYPGRKINSVHMTDSLVMPNLMHRKKAAPAIIPT